MRVRSNENMAATAQSLIVVSNRLPVKLQRDREGRWDVTASAGGLVTALTPVLRRRGGTWVGWAGASTSDVDALAAQLDTTDSPYRLVPVALDDDDVERFYRGFANQIVWPLFHDCFHLCNFDPDFWRAYRDVNRKFARAVAALAKPDDAIWVHDYQLMGVGAALRELGVDNEIGFFNHIPFPTPDIFCRLPWREAILDSLLEYDLVGFQLPRDERHFHECLGLLRPSGAPFGDAMPTNGGRHDPRTDAQRDPRTGSFPISIDFEEFAAEAGSDGVRVLAGQLKEAYSGRKLVLGIDRLDYSKGLLEKLAAFRRALEKYPQLRGSVTLLQYVVPSRQEVPEYRALRLRIERTVGEINGAFSEPGWIPVHYHFQSLSRRELCACYRAADVCLITSQKDGMNLVAKEYCAAQVADPGVLILSEFTGAAAELGEQALRINPFDVEAVAAAIYRALVMGPSERARRMRLLREHVSGHDVYRWVERYLAVLSPAPHGSRAETSTGLEMQSDIDRVAI